MEHTILSTMTFLVMATQVVNISLIHATWQHAHHDKIKCESSWSSNHLCFAARPLQCDGHLCWALIDVLKVPHGRMESIFDIAIYGYVSKWGALFSPKSSHSFWDTSLYIYVYICICMYMYMYLYMYMYMCMYMCMSCMYVCMYLFIYLFMYISIDMYWKDKGIDISQ